MSATCETTASEFLLARYMSSAAVIHPLLHLSQEANPGVDLPAPVSGPPSPDAFGALLFWIDTSVQADKFSDKGCGTSALLFLVSTSAVVVLLPSFAFLFPAISFAALAPLPAIFFLFLADTFANCNRLPAFGVSSASD